ncbi:MAG TPA: HAD hydrolase-like protein [Noviherbaspirillum sp.]|jgi:phosphoglycolate phosphatase|uniref:HAD hydrolase-like protein n=1 Tax=Noviherbaspirillum sp. TaxID=1926288 RepID=UPI002F959A33
MTYRFVVFDFDGTLADSFPWFLRTFNGLAGKYRFRPITPDEVDALRGLGSRELVAHLQLPMWKVPMVTAEMRRRMTEQVPEIPLFEGVDRLLVRLHEHGIETAVLTSNTRENVQRILGPHNTALIRHFECGVSIFGKEARFRKLVRRARADPARVLCVGDEIRDAQAAAAAGLAFAGVAWGYTRPDVLALHSKFAPFHTTGEIGDMLCG